MNQQKFAALKETSFLFRNDSVKLRRARLSKITTWINQHEEDIFFALQQDFNKPRF